MQKNKKPKYLKPQNRLKSKVGSGGIDQKYIKEAEEVINNNTIDFGPYALKLLDGIKRAIDSGKENSPDKPSDTFIKTVTPSFMQIKAHGALFHYHLLTDVANNILHFMEHTKVWNADAYKLIEAHYNTMIIITKNAIQGDGGKDGDCLLDELSSARERYISKYITPEQTS